MTLTVATCQFPIDSDIRRNFEYISQQMTDAKSQGAQVAHFPEGALSGYAGVDFSSFEGFNWDLLKASTLDVIALARKLRLWVILGSAHRLSGDHKPHNSLYIINDAGHLIDRYDKMFCAGDAAG
ncbi:MAG: carbon-nitrogen hydrolase family protein, partial [Anaerolineae bacterium]|nr:carbon-nitrogen hydrolase family protein [Anaerolineae bacterium]